MNFNRKRDIFAALLFLIIGLVTLFVLIPTGVKVPGSVKVAALSPDFWPRLIAIGAIVTAVLLFIETLTMQQPHFEEEGSEESTQYQLDTFPASLRIIVMIAALFAFYAGLATLGVVAASAVMMALMMLFFGERKVLLVLVLSAVTPVALYLFFRHVAGIPVPLGIFGN